jgi:hypothetical protein
LKPVDICDGCVQDECTSGRHPDCCVSFECDVPNGQCKRAFSTTGAYPNRSACVRACEAPPKACTGSSKNLTSGDCIAWQHFSRDPMYKEWAEGKCGAQVHTDPCSCIITKNPPMHLTGCEGGNRITALVMPGLPPRGGVPLALLNLTGLVGFSLGGNQLVGTIPSAIGQLVELTDLSLGTNQLTGSVPTEMTQLTKLSNIRLDTNRDLTGPLPAFNFTQFAKCCAMEGDSFKCPLPAGAEKCAGGPGPGCGSRSLPKCIPTPLD